MKNLKKALAAVMAGTLLIAATGCSSVPYIEDEDDFLDALEEVAGIDEDDCSIWEDSTVNGDDTEFEIYATDKISYTYIRFEDEEDCYDYFEEYYEEVEDMVKDGDFDGNRVMKLTDTQGYITLKGEADGDDFDGDICCSISFKNNVFIAVIVDSTKDSKVEDVKEFTKALGLPTPR